MYQIKSRFSGKILFEMECTSFKVCVEAAISAGTDLTEADLFGANLTGADGKKTTIEKTPIQISGLRWHIIIFDKDMRIGCEYHSLADWWLYDDARIKKMDCTAPEFCNQYKTMLQEFRHPGVHGEPFPPPARCCPPGRECCHGPRLPWSRP